MSHLGEKHFVNRLDYIKAQKNLIQKGLYGGLPCEDLIQKGEGSKGGKVIGHTISGKPIYENANHASHKDFTAVDHGNAAFHHQKEAEKAEESGDHEKQNYHTKQSKEHADLATKVANEKGKGKDKYDPSEGN